MASIANRGNRKNRKKVILRKLKDFKCTQCKCRNVDLIRKNYKNKVITAELYLFYRLHKLYLRSDKKLDYHLHVIGTKGCKNKHFLLPISSYHCTYLHYFFIIYKSLIPNTSPTKITRCSSSNHRCYSSDKVKDIYSIFYILLSKYTSRENFLDPNH